MGEQAIRLSALGGQPGGVCPADALRAAGHRRDVSRQAAAHAGTSAPSARRRMAFRVAPTALR